MKTMLFAMAIWALTLGMSYGQYNALTPGHEYEVELCAGLRWASPIRQTWRRCRRSIKSKLTRDNLCLEQTRGGEPGGQENVLAAVARAMREPLLARDRLISRSAIGGANRIRFKQSAKSVIANAWSRSNTKPMGTKSADRMPYSSEA